MSSMDCPREQCELSASFLICASSESDYSYWHVLSLLYVLQMWFFVTFASSFFYKSYSSLFTLTPLLPHFSPCGSPLCPLCPDLSFSLSQTHSCTCLHSLGPHTVIFNPFITSHLSSLFVSHTLYFPSCYFLSPSVFCVSRTLTVTQIY